MDAALRNAPSQAEMLRDDLGIKHADILARADELLAAALRVPDTVGDDETAGKVGDFIKQITACGKAAESARVSEKEPHLAASRVVDGFFKAVTDPLDKAKKGIESRLTVFLRAKEEAARKERERIAAEERAAAEAARKAAEEAEKAAQDSAGLATAIDAAEAARKAQADAETATKAAEVKAAELSRSRGEYGSLASLRTFMDFADLDRATLDLEALRHHLPVEALEKAVRAYIKAGGRELRGVRIYENTQASVR